MKKLTLVILIGIMLLAGSLGLFSGNSNEAKLDASLPGIQNANAMDFKTGMVAPGKDGVPNKEAIMTKAASIAVPFVKNVGQFNAEVQYSADLFSGRFFLTNKELVYSLIQHSGKQDIRSDKLGRKTELENWIPDKGIAFKEFFVDQKGDLVDFKLVGEEKALTKISYFRGNDPAKWQSGLVSFIGVSLGEVYPGIEVKLKASNKNVEKIFIVGPQGGVTKIKIGVAGVKRLKISKNGQLKFKNNFADLSMRAPIAWQEINGQCHEVKVGYRLLAKHCYGFVVLGEYNKNISLIIDPALDTLIPSTYFGGTGSDSPAAIVLDPAGNIYLTGTTISPDFPTTVGGYDLSLNPQQSWYSEFCTPCYYYPTDIFISKLNSNLTTLLASTYLGGEYSDSAYSLTLDSSGNVYLAGYAESPDFPTTQGAYSREHKGSYDAFVAKLDCNLTRLLASTFLGGSSLDSAQDMALDQAGDIYLTGSTFSEDFPTTPGAYDRYADPYRSEVFISKLDGNLTELLASSYLGGWDADFGGSLALDSSGNVFITGETDSPNFPVTPGAYDPVFKVVNWYDIFISKLNSDLTTLLASTFLGGSKHEWAVYLILDSSANVFVTGSTGSADFPTTPGAFSRTKKSNYNYLCTDVFISMLNNDLTQLLASTYLGGSRSQTGSSLSLDGSGNVYVTGDTSSADFPTTIGAYDRTINTGKNEDYPYYSPDDVFVSKLNRDFTDLLASTFLGGSSGDYAPSVAVDSFGDIYVTGSTSSADFPTTPGAYDRAFDGSPGYRDVFIAKLNGSLISITVNSPNGGENWNNGSSQNITWTSVGTIGNVTIDYSINNGSSWINIATSTANDGSYAWAVPCTPSSQCLVRVNDAAYPAISDTSDAVFSITNTPPQVEIVSPENNAAVYGVLNVIANATDDSGIARVEFYVDGVLKEQAATAQTAAKKLRLASGASKISKKRPLNAADPNPEIKVFSANAQYTFTWNTMAASLGAHVLRVVAYDDAGAMGADDVTVQVIKVNLDLQAEWREIRAFSILRYYGLIQFSVDNPGIPVTQYRIMRRKGAADFVLLRTITPAELQNNQFQMQDKFLDKSTTYTYRVEVYNASGQLVGISSEKTI